MDPDNSLPPLDTMAHGDWNPTSVPLQSSSAGGAMPSILTTEYDPFGPYDSYGDDMYAAQSHTISHSPPAPGLPHSRSPGPSMSRASMLYGPGASGIPQGTPRLKLEGPGDYDQAGDISQYPSPRSGHAHHQADPGAYSQQSTGYLSDGQSSAWSKPDYPPLEPDQYYSGTEGQAASMFDDGRRGQRVQRTQRRVPRRLTTKEEANYQCEVKGCGKLFSRSYNYKAHLETHDEKREYPFPCPVNDCNKKFVRKTDLQRHHQSVHMKERNHRCDYCGRLFARKDTLRRHMEDGCSKRFDIGTLDLRADGYDNVNQGGRMGPMVPSPGTLPPLALPPTGSGGLLSTIPPPLRNRNTPDQTHGHSWGR